MKEIILRYLILLTIGILIPSTLVSQVTFNGSGGGGFGAPVSGSTMSWNHDATTITVTFTKGLGNFNDRFVIYISTGATGRTLIGTQVNDRADGLRSAISYIEAGANKTLYFPPGFQATHAIAIDVVFGGLWSIPSSGSIGNNALNFISSVNSTLTSNTQASFTFSFTWAQLGINSGDAIDFVATYGNPFGGDGSLGFYSDEGYGGGLPSGNIGQNDFTFTTYYRYPDDLVGGNAATTAPGNWSLNGTWANGNPPLSGDATSINHNTTLNQNATVSSMTIANSNSLTINEGQSLTVSGALTNNAGAAGLVIESDATGTGSLITNGTVTGNVTVQRYIPGATWTNWKDGWHALSSPVSAQDISPNFVIDPAADYDFYTWYEPNNIWVNFKNTSNAPTWNTANTIDNNLTNDAAEFLVGKGYLVAYKTTDTKVFTGTLNSDDVVISNLDITDAEATKSFHLLGNPFASALQWNADWTKTNIAATVQVWSELLQDYSALEYGSYIPAMNGFMVEVTADDASITIPKLEREHNSTAWYKSLDNQSLKLTVMDQDNVSGKETMIRFNPGSTTGFDVDFDGSYLQGYGPVFYSLSEDNKLSVNTLPTATNDLTIPIVFSKNDAEIFWLQASGVESMPYTVYLTDTKLNYTQNLQSNPYYSFTSNEGDDPNRFLLHFGAVGVDEAVPTTAVSAYVHNNTLYLLNASGKVQVDVMDISGRLVHSQSLQTTGLSSTPLSLPAGVYVVRLNDGQTSRTDKVIVQ